MEKNEAGAGSIIGIIIIIAVIILGGLYFWGKRAEDSKAVQNLTQEPSTTTEDTSEASIIKNTSTSDDLDAIDSDLKATNTDNLDTELK